MAFIAQIIDKSPHKKFHINSADSCQTARRLHVINWRPRSRAGNLCLFVTCKNTAFPVEEGGAGRQSGSQSRRFKSKPHARRRHAALRSPRGGRVVVTSARSRFLPPPVGVRWVSSVIGSRHGPPQSEPKPPDCVSSRPWRESKTVALTTCWWKNTLRLQALAIINN